jgi:carboxypeptidase family protein
MAMKHTGELSKALMLIAAGLYLLASLSTPSAASQEGGEISGIVRDEFSSFIAGANIRLYSFERVLQTKADATGHFQLSNVPVGTYELEVTSSGFKTKTIEQLKVSGGSRLTYDVPLRIANPGPCSPLDSISYERRGTPRGLSVEGVVVDAGSAAKPLPGVEVRLFHTSDNPISHKTNERGQFVFSVDQAGRYFIQIARPGYRTDQSQQFWVTREGQTVVTMRQLKVGWFIACE